MATVRNKLAAIALDLNAKVALLVDLFGLNNNVLLVEAVRLTTNVRTLHHTCVSCFKKLIPASIGDDSKLVQVPLCALASTVNLAFDIAIGMTRSLRSKLAIHVVGSEALSIQSQLGGCLCWRCA